MYACVCLFVCACVSACAFVCFGVYACVSVCACECGTCRRPITVLVCSFARKLLVASSKSLYSSKICRRQYMRECMEGVVILFCVEGEKL